MSFSGGTFSINTTGQPVVSGTTISASVFNALTADLATGLSTCMLKDGTQTATAGIGFYAGTVSLPGIYFGTDTATGFYRIGLNNNGYTVNGTKLWDWSAAAATLTGALTVSAGITLSGTASNLATGSNYISNGGTDAGLSFDASNNATFSAALAITGALTGVTTLAASGDVSVGTIAGSLTAKVSVLSTGVQQSWHYNATNRMFLLHNGTNGYFGTYDSQPLILRTNNTDALTINTSQGATLAGALAIGNTLNAVSPTSPNRTITMVVGGTTVYIACKTTND